MSAKLKTNIEISNKTIAHKIYNLQAPDFINNMKSGAYFTNFTMSFGVHSRILQIFSNVSNVIFLFFLKCQVFCYLYPNEGAHIATYLFSSWFSITDCNL